MNSKEIYEELSSGRWIHSPLVSAVWGEVDEEDLSELISRLAVHFQELFAAYHLAVAQEESEEEAERVRIAEDVEANPHKIGEYRAGGWVVTKRAKKLLDLDGFLADHEQDIPKEALAIVKAKLPAALKKELVKYEQIEKYSYSVKRYQTQD